MLRRALKDRRILLIRDHHHNLDIERSGILRIQNPLQRRTAS